MSNERTEKALSDIREMTRRLAFVVPEKQLTNDAQITFKLRTDDLVRLHIAAKSKNIKMATLARSMILHCLNELDERRRAETERR